MTTLVLCVNRTNGIGHKTGLLTPVVGQRAVRSFITGMNLSDPEDSNVNCLLAALRTARELRNRREDTEITVILETSDSATGADYAVTRQLNDLAEQFDVESAVVVIDNTEGGQLVPVVESRFRVDAVGRVVVQQAHNIGSTYYLLRQLLGNRELRSTVLILLDVGLLLIPLLLVWFSPEVAMAGLAALMGAVLLYRGSAVDEFLSDARDQIRDALYSGQVSVVAYAIAAGLAIVGLFLGTLTIRSPGVGGGKEVLIPSLLFIYYGMLWVALATLTASAGRLLDELIRSECVSASYVNLPFDVVTIGLVIRGFTGLLLERQGELADLGLLRRLAPAPIQRLTMFIVTDVVMNVVGIRVSANVPDETLKDIVDTPRENKS